MNSRSSEITIQIKADVHCRECHGEGYVYDTVDYGSTTAQLPSLCDCIERQVPEDFDGDIDVIPSGYYAEPIMTKQDWEEMTDAEKDRYLGIEEAESEQI